VASSSLRVNARSPSIPRGRVGRGALRVGEGAERGAIGGRGAGGGQRDGFGGQRPPDLERGGDHVRPQRQVPEQVHGAVPQRIEHPDPLPLAGADEALRLEVGQRGAQRGAGDPERHRQLALGGQEGVGRCFAAEDRPAERVGDAVDGAIAGDGGQGHW
jgi:hypothetical protein